MIRVDHLSLRYGPQTILDDISFRVKKGDFVLLCGPSGCGKSTLAFCLAGHIPGEDETGISFDGQIRIAGCDTRPQLVSEQARRVGLVFQNPATQLFNATVAEEIAFGPINLDLSQETVRERVAWAMSATGTTALAERSVRQLSGGEQQRVAIASILAMQPEVLILDEPTANLDWRGVRQVGDTLRYLHRDLGLTIVLIEHRLGAVLPLANHMLLMENGRIVADAPPAEILSNKERWAALGLRYPWLDSDRRLGRLDLLPPSTGHASQALVTLENVTAKYGKRTVLDDVNLTITPGSFIALVGENGAGKSTIARLLAGMIRPAAGRIRWHRSLKRLPAGRRIGLLFQNPLHQLVCDRVIDEVSFGPRNFRTNGQLEPLMRAADLVHLEERRPYALSVGQQQRTALAATLALQPRLLILDEPILGQDWLHLSRLMDYLSELYRQGQTILLITHDDRLVCRYAKQLIRLEDGRITEHGMIPHEFSPTFQDKPFLKETTL